MYTWRFVSVLVLLVGCSMGNQTSSVVVRDSAGVELIETVRPLWQAGEAWSVFAEPDLSIGQLEGDPQYQFHDITDAIRLSDGRIVVADGGSNTARYYSAEGRFLRVFGRSGEGPGEFRRIQALRRLAGDSILVVDAALHRATVLDGAGDLSSFIPLDPTGEPASFQHLEDGRAVGMVRDALRSLGAVRVGVHRLPATVVVYDADGAPLDTVGVFAGYETALTDLGGQVVQGVVPFGRTLSLAAHGESIYVGTGDVLGYEIYTPDGEKVRSVRATGLDLVLREDDLAALKGAVLDEAPDEAARAALERYWDHAPRPEQRAAYSRMLVDAAGNVWLSDYEMPPYFNTGVWRVFDSGGRYLGEVDVPQRLHILEIGKMYVLGVWRDGLGVESVRLYRLKKG